MLDKIMKSLAAIVAIALIGYIIFLKMPGASASSKEVVAELSAAQLYDAYTNNEKTAQSNYLGKAIVISGEIYDKYEDETGSGVVLLGPGDGDPYALVTLDGGQEKKLDALKVGNQVKIKAICTGMLMEVTLNKGLIQ